MIPVAVLTGFLGSGKTTLLSRLLKSPQFSRTAVIINEFGEVGLDHELVETSEESIVELQTGCLCCTVRGDLVRTLDDLLRRRDEGTVNPFERVVIETSGLADPAPILHAVMDDTALARRLSLSGVITTVDAINGLITLAQQPESLKQVAVADRLVLTKTDLVGGASHKLVERLTALNPTAPMVTSSFGAVDADQLFDIRLDTSVDWRPPACLAEPAHDVPFPHASHDREISCFTILRKEPMRAITLTLLLKVLAEHCGENLLRLKGIANVLECPDRPAVIHGVQHVFHPPAWLERWPSEDPRTRLIFIVRNTPQAWIEALLEALESEVKEVTQGIDSSPDSGRRGSIAHTPR